MVTQRIHKGRELGLAGRTLIFIFITAVVVNYAWELAQAPLYIGLKDYNAGVFWHCFVAALGDGIMVLLIVAAGWITLRRPDWFIHPGVLEYLVMMTAGFVLAVVVEWLALHILRRWEYTEMMPKLPGLNIGLVPIAQMLVVPPIIFRIVDLLERKAP